MLSTMTRNKVLKVIRRRDPLGFRSSQKVLHHRVRVVSEGHGNGAIRSMDIPIVACSLVRLVLSHQRNELFCGPALGLKVIIVRCGRTRVHHEIYGRAAA